jgi:DNA-directed RNA polymerase sigma subunit (sigma70/sigma32)
MEPIMNRIACSENEAVLVVESKENARIRCIIGEQGTFSLRRARYFSAAGKELMPDLEQNLGKEDYAEMKRKLITKHMSLVVDIALHYANRGVAMLDLIMKGSLGLIYALEKFELEESVRFSAYARLCIHEYIEHAIMNQNNRQTACICVHSSC